MEYCLNTYVVRYIPRMLETVNRAHAALRPWVNRSRTMFAPVTTHKHLFH